MPCGLNKIGNKKPTRRISAFPSYRLGKNEKGEIGTVVWRLAQHSERPAQHSERPAQHGERPAQYGEGGSVQSTACHYDATAKPRTSANSIGYQAGPASITVASHEQSGAVKYTLNIFYKHSQLDQLIYQGPFGPSNFKNFRNIFLLSSNCECVCIPVNINWLTQKTSPEQRDDKLLRAKEN